MGRAWSLAPTQPRGSRCEGLVLGLLRAGQADAAGVLDEPGAARDGCHGVLDRVRGAGGRRRVRRGRRGRLRSRELIEVDRTRARLAGFVAVLGFFEHIDAVEREWRG